MADNSTGSPVSGNPYAPQEPSALITAEIEDFVGMHLADMLYGITVLLFFKCASQLLWPKHGQGRNLLLAGYTFILFSLGTIFTGMNINVAVLGFIKNRNFPGGPEAYSSFAQLTPIGITPNATFIIANWLADAFMMWRCRVIWNGNWWILVFPCIMYLGSFAMGVMTLFQSTRPNANLWFALDINFALPYFSISSALNIILTILIITRLIMHQRRVADRRSAAQYLDIITMFIESSAIYAISSFLFIGTFGAGNSAALIFLPILSQTQIIAPLLIISRVSTRKDWTHETARDRNNLSSVGGTTTQVKISTMNAQSTSGSAVNDFNGKLTFYHNALSFTLLLPILALANVASAAECYAQRYLDSRIAVIGKEIAVSRTTRPPMASPQGS
ncbi:hypothetical protein BDZ94DRAFT_1308285 [Collybia nuda]|uniref:Uncharacterized protein n=1 Tax=Collybia nuda TaxID=64659 RepID=A0A9P5Y7B9_9AGAR|nr:hypothetical protein BDZ94DRAFT_1308285 [Collybia nuda]